MGNLVCLLLSLRVILKQSSKREFGSLNGSSNVIWRIIVKFPDISTTVFIFLNLIIYSLAGFCSAAAKT